MDEREATNKVAILIERTTVLYFLSLVQPDYVKNFNPEQLDLYHAMKEAIDA